MQCENITVSVNRTLSDKFTLSDKITLSDNILSDNSLSDQVILSYDGDYICTGWPVLACTLSDRAGKRRRWLGGGLLPNGKLG
jgi:hypothetical protein